MQNSEVAAAPIASAAQDIGALTTRQVLLRLGSFILLMNILSWLDRANVSFAALQMNAELGFDPKIYGLGVGLFSITHVLFQVPMADLATRVGCRRALAAMMICWGVLAASMGLMQSATQFYVLRLLLGVAEAAVGPITLLYASRWIPQKSMASFMVWVMLSVPLGVIIGAPISSYLIGAMHDVTQLSGWRWMFIVEGIPSVLLGLFALVWLTEKPTDASWLAPERKSWLLRELESNRAAGSPHGEASGGGITNLRWILRDRLVLSFAFTLYCLVTGLNGLLYWMPQLVGRLTTGDAAHTIVLSGIPWFGAIAGMVIIARHSDRANERFLHVAGALIIGAIGLLLSFNLDGTVAALLALTLALFGIGGAMATFWAVPVGHVRGREGSAIALTTINVIGFSAGFFTHILIGWLRAATGGFEAPLWMLAGVLTLGALIVASARPASDASISD